MPIEKAIWYPSWYELDPTLEVGSVDEFHFFRVVPDHLANEDDPIFYGDLWGDKHLYYSARKRILKIHHPQIGDIQKIYTRGLDYTITLTDGTILKVEAEETPGVVYDLPEPVRDWRVFVEMEPAE